MAISKRVGKNGKARFTVSVNVPPDYEVGVPNHQRRAGRRDTIGTFPRKSDAEIEENRAKDAIRKGEFIPTWIKSDVAAAQLDPKTWTVAAVVDGWLVGRKATVTANTYSQYESAYRIHLKPAIGDCDISVLTRADVRAELRTWQAAGMGAQLQNRVMLVLRCALDEAVEDGILAANAAAGISLPSPKKRRDISHWTPDDLRGFLVEGERDQLGVFWHLTALEGMRRAEGLALRWGDLHWNADETECAATIVQTTVPDMANGGAPLVQARAKTKGSQRTVTLTRPTVEALKRHHDRQAFQRQKLAEIWPAGLGLIVTDELGGVVRPDAVKRHRLAVIAVAGVPDPGTHGLRHLAATAMLRAGVSPAIVAQKIGHSDISLTVSVYGHLVPADQASANAALEAFLAKPTPTGTG